jgi:lysophospholipase L1-like esterase
MTIGKKLIVAAVIVLVTLAALEATLWLVPVPDPYPMPTRRFHRYLSVWNYWEWTGIYPTPPFSMSFDFGPLHGVEPGPSALTINEYGFLYPPGQHERAGDEEIRVALIGGSTVECIVLRPERRCSGVLEAILSEKYPDHPVTVLNLGISGQATPTHLSTVAQHAVKLDLDAIVFVLGANDLYRAASDWRTFNDSRSFITINSPGFLRYAASRLQLMRRYRLLAWRIRTPAKGRTARASGPSPYYAEMAAKRAALPVLPFEPELRDEALADYERNILSLAGMAQIHDIEVLFATQPMLWKESPTPEEEAVDWMGTMRHDGQTFRLTSGMSAHLLETLNRRLIDTCERHGIEYMDLSSVVPRSLDAFYDCLHYNENGARLVAAAIGEALVSSGTFDKSRQ